MSNSWVGLIGLPRIVGGSAGTVVLPANAILISVQCHASVAAATCTIMGQQAVPVPSGSTISFAPLHTLFAVSNGLPNQIVFVNTDSYLVHFITTGHAS